MVCHNVFLKQIQILIKNSIDIVFNKIDLRSLGDFSSDQILLYDLKHQRIKAVEHPVGLKMIKSVL